LARSRTDTERRWRDPTGTWLGGLRGSGERVSLLWLAPLGVATAYLILFLIRIPHNVEILGWDPDVASAFLIPETLVKTGTGGQTVMASAGQWVPLWFGLLTARLPLHRELWGITPTLDFYATALIVGWSVSRLAGRRAGVLAVLIGVVASPVALVFFMAPFSHNTVYPGTALLGAYLVWLARDDGRRSLARFAVPPVLGIAIGTCLSSDLLLAATAVIPLGLTTVLAAAQRDRRSRLVALSSATTIAVALPAAAITSSIMRSEGFLKLPSPIKVATVAELPARAELLFKGLKVLFNGYLGTAAPGILHAELGWASDVVLSAALLTLVVLGLRTAATFLWRGLRVGSAYGAAQLARSLHIIYWVTSAAVACGAFWIAGEGPTTTHESYYATAVFSVAAVIPLLLSRASPARWLIPVGASIFFVASFVGLADGYVGNSRKITGSAPTALIARNAKILTRIATQNHVRFGFSDWGDASSFTWGTHEQVVVRPLSECAVAEEVRLCPGFQAYVPSWYAPRQGPSFLLVEPHGVELREPPSNLGKPLAGYSFDGIEMFVYPYDIASRLA
jgi:hypothetical protein